MDTESEDHSLLKLLRMRVFSEVRATISPEFLDTIAAADLSAFLTNLDSEHGIGYEVDSSTVCRDGRQPFIIKGNLDQIILAKIKLEKAVMEGFSDGVRSSPNVTTTATMTEGLNCPSPTTAKLRQLTRKPSNPPTDLDASVASIRSRRKRGRPRKVRLLDKQANLLDVTNNNDTGNKFHQDASTSADATNNNNNNNNDDDDEDDKIAMDGSTVSSEFDDVNNGVGDSDAIAAINSSSETHLRDTRRSGHVSHKFLEGAFKYDCELCPFSTEREGQLLKHVLIHGKSNAVYKCDKCCFTSVSRNHFKRHRMHHMDSLLHCPQCSFETDDTKLLSRHVALRHTLQLVGGVASCSSKMSDADVQNLIARSSVLQCNECGYSTTKIYHFERHLLVHNRDLKGLLQVYQCEECDYKTHRKEHYIRHKENVHVGHKSCSHCGIACRSSSALLRHLITVHDDESTTVATTSPMTIAAPAPESANADEDFSGQLAASCLDISLSVPLNVITVDIKPEGDDG